MRVFSGSLYIKTDTNERIKNWLFAEICIASPWGNAGRAIRTRTYQCIFKCQILLLIVLYSQWVNCTALPLNIFRAIQRTVAYNWVPWFRTNNWNSQHWINILFFENVFSFWTGWREPTSRHQLPWSCIGTSVPKNGLYMPLHKKFFVFILHLTKRNGHIKYKALP